jgi:hypothetical protein
MSIFGCGLLITESYRGYWKTKQHCNSVSRLKRLTIDVWCHYSSVIFSIALVFGLICGLFFFAALGVNASHRSSNITALLLSAGQV